VKSSLLERLRCKRYNISKYLVAKLLLFPFDTWVSLFITENFITKNEIQLRTALNESWVAGKALLSYGIISVLTSLPMFMLSFSEISKGVQKRLEFYRSRFFW
jgi:hypothetical protein